MNLKQIQYFVAVAEELHFGRAAERLNVVQPAISQQIKLLENDLGISLFVRSSRKVALTDAGRAFFVEARRLAEQVETAKQSARDAVAGMVGTLRIGFVDNAIWATLPSIIREFRSNYPRVELVLSQMPRGQQLAKLEMGDLDLAIMPGKVLPPRIVSLELARTQMQVALPKGHVLADRGGVEISAFAQEPLIAMPDGDNSHCINEVVRQLCVTAGFDPIFGQAVDQMHTALSLVSTGLGVAFVPKWICRAWSENVEYRPLLPTTEYVLYACYREQRANKMLQALLRIVAAHAGRSPVELEDKAL